MLRRCVLVVALGAAVVALTAASGASASSGHAVSATAGKAGELDCNGYSRIQKSVRPDMACTDLHIVYDGVPGRFYDNGHYIGHDEPSVRFLSSRPGSGNNVTFNETLPRDPSAMPTVGKPGSDVTHWFELSVAPWFGMPICDSNSYPLTHCTPTSDKNTPRGAPTYQVGGGGSAVLELQFYPPGMAPFADAISCDNTHWCAALNIDSLECNRGFEKCNTSCEEPVNFAYLQRDGVPTGPPSPQEANGATFTPNSQTLMMNPGDRITAHIFDARLAGGGRALETAVTDHTTGQTGYMIASASNGFMHSSFANCSGTPYNFQPEYSTAKLANIVPWAALKLGILSEYEIGHFTPCSSISGRVPGGGDPTWTTCHGAYENSTGPDGPNSAESTDAPCFPKGDTHLGTAAPNEVTGCLDFNAGGDLDYDGSSYWPDWPNSVTPNRFPSTFLVSPPTSNGAAYSQMQFETDAPASESTCSGSSLSGCAVPPPTSPGKFYPYFSQVSSGGGCIWEFGQMPNGNNYGRDGQYGAPSAYFFGTLSGPIRPNTC